MKSRGSKQNSHGQKNKAGRLTPSTKLPASHGKRKLVSEIAALFRGIGLKEGEEIPELRGYEPKVPDFEG